MKADVVVPSLHIGGVEILWQHALKKRNVLFHQLFLKILGPGRNSYATATAKRRRNRRHKVSERLAGSSARFDDQMATLFKRAHHRPRHINLAGAVFVIRKGLGD